MDVASHGFFFVWWATLKIPGNTQMPVPVGSHVEARCVTQKEMFLISFQDLELNSNHHFDEPFFKSKNRSPVIIAYDSLYIITSVVLQCH